MKIVFVQNFLLDSSGLPSDDILYPHLGLISLIAEIEKSRHLPLLYDPMLQMHKGQLTLDSSIYGDVAEQLLQTEPSAVGLTALGCNFIAVVKIARRIKERRPKTLILLGGPHPTVLESPIMTTFTDFDVLVRGEAEETIVPLLDALDSGKELSAVPGISYRDGSRVCRSTADAGVMDVDRLSMAAFHFYPIHELKMRSMRVEAGRGCPFHCTFCSTATFFGRKYRVKSAEKLVRELKSLNNTYNITEFSLQHDLFTVNRRKVLEFCEEVRPCGFTWVCSARIDCVDSELLREMARSGCRGIYFGVETGSSSLQELVRKRLDLHLLHPTLKCAKDLALNVTTSFITGFPKETISDVEATLDCLDSCLRISPTTTCLQLHLLTPEPGTALYEENKNQLLYDGHISDFNFPTLAGDESALLRGNPDIFMNHHFYKTDLPRNTFVGVTSIFPQLCALGGPLLRIVMEYLEITFSSLVFTILSRCERGSITYQRVFRELLSLINEKRAGRRLVRQLVEFAFAHVRALQPKIRTDFQNGTNGTEKVMCLTDGVTLFRRTFDIPSVLDQINDRAGAWRSIPTRSKAHSFVVHGRQTTYESRTLRISDDVAEILQLFKTPRREGRILEKFPAAEAAATSAAIDDLFRRGVLCECTETDHRFGGNDVLLDCEWFG
jgi:radical SAM superfamily enzyme YgiQ (UPF0313 family)